MCKTIVDRVLIVSPNSTGIVPQFGDAAVEERIVRALTQFPLEVEFLDYSGFRELWNRLTEVAPPVIILPNGIHAEPDPGAPFLASLLDRRGLAYVGSDAVGMASVCKIWNKGIMSAGGVPVLPHSVFPGPDATSFLRRATGPLIMKPEFGANSEGVIRVESMDDAPSVAAALHEQYGQRILMEPWARAREYTVALLETGPRELLAAPLEILLEAGDAFLSRDVKRHRVAGTHRRVTDSGRHAAVCRLARRAFQTCHLRDLGRIDILETCSGELMVIDVNPHPGFKPGPQRPSYFPAAFAFEYQWSYEDVVLALVARCAERAGYHLPRELSARYANLRGRK